MKNLFLSFKYTFAALVAVLLISVSNVVFGVTEDTEKEITTTQIDDCKMMAYTDPQVMAAAMANPAKFMELMTLLNDPQTTQNMMDCSMETEQWNEIIANMTNPAKMMAASGQFMNPEMYMAWMTAMMNPAFYTQWMNVYMNPAFYTQWMNASMNPAFYQSMFKMMDPKWQQEATVWMMNPENYQKMFESMYNIAPVVADAKPSQQ
jgi:hypothetical protein